MTRLPLISFATLMVLLATPAVADAPSQAESASATGASSVAWSATGQAGLARGSVDEPPVGYDWKSISAAQDAARRPLDEPASLTWTLAVFAAAGLMFTLAILGLTLTYRSLRTEMRRDRIHYRPRGPHSTHETA
jgi:hypothetical protein